MYRARIPLAAAAVVLLTTIAVLLSVRTTLVERRGSGSAEARRARAGHLAVARPAARHRSHQRDGQAGARRRVRRHLRQEGLGRAAPGGVRRGLGAQRRGSRRRAQGRPRRRRRRQRPRGGARSQHQRHVRRRPQGRYPSVGKALDGVANKDVWNFDGHLYRVGAAPIRSRAGAVVGALVVGYVTSATDAAADRDKLGTEVAYFLDGKIHASSFRKEGGESAEENELARAALRRRRAWPTARSAGNLTPPTAVKIGGDDYLAAAGPLPGNLTQVEVGLRGAGVADGGARATSAASSSWCSCSGSSALLVAVGAAVLTAMRFLRPLDQHRDRRGRGHQRQPRLLVRHAVEGLRGAGQRAQRHAGAPARPARSVGRRARASERRQRAALGRRAVGRRRRRPGRRRRPSCRRSPTSPRTRTCSAPSTSTWRRASRPTKASRA